MIESDLVSKCMKQIRMIPKVFCWKEHGGMYGTAGIPDIIVCANGRFIGLEVKLPGGRYGATALQLKTIEDIARAGGTAAVVRSVEEAVQIVKEAMHYDDSARADSGGAGMAGAIPDSKG